DRELAVGFLMSEGVISTARDLVAVEPGRSSDPAARNSVDVTLAPGIEPEGDFSRHFSATSACGVCGRASIESVRARAIPPRGDFAMTAARLCDVPDRLVEAQPVFAHTGGLHAAALFDESGAIVVAREDIGRHNAVDKVIGWALLSGRVDLSVHGLLVSGRGGFEIVQKAVVAGIPLIACVSAPSSLAVQLAREAHSTLVGFLRGSRFVVYAGEDRLLLEQSPPSRADTEVGPYVVHEPRAADSRVSTPGSEERQNR
ncbi:MAG: formate dehydrogenase accessory sulfurtransferase FdhD, partial [Bacteroidales bacterium]